MYMMRLFKLIHYASLFSGAPADRVLDGVQDQGPATHTYIYIYIYRERCIMYMYMYA